MTQPFAFDAPAFTVTKSYRDENGQMFIEGIASTIDIDETDERMSPEAIALMAARLPGKPLREEHQKGYLNILGQIIQADVIKDTNGNPALWIKAKLHDWSSAAKDTFQAIKSGVKLGLSVAGSIHSGGLVKELDESRGKYIPTYKDIEPSEVSVTDHPANLGTFALAVAKSLNTVEPVETIEKDVTNAHETKPSEYKDVPTADFLDPENYKYPADDSHLMAALRYFNHKGQRTAGGYSASQWQQMGEKLAKKLSSKTGDSYHYDSSREQVTKEETKKAEEVSDMTKRSGLASKEISGEVASFIKGVGGNLDEFEKAGTSSDDSTSTTSTDSTKTPAMEVVGDKSSTSTDTTATGSDKTGTGTTSTDSKTTPTSTTSTKKDISVGVMESSSGSEGSSESTDSTETTTTGTVEGLLSEIMSTLSQLSSTGSTSTTSTPSTSTTSTESTGSTSTDSTESSPVNSSTMSLEDCLSSLAVVMEGLKGISSTSTGSTSTGSTSTGTTSATPTSTTSTDKADSTLTDGSKGSNVSSTTATTSTESTEKALREIAQAVKGLAEHQQKMQKSLDNLPNARKGYARVVEKHLDGGDATKQELLEKLQKDPSISFKEQFAYKEFGKIPAKYAK